MFKLAKDKVTVLEDVFPSWDIGAPSPCVFADEHIVMLGYYTRKEEACVVTFNHCFEYKMGMPDENTIHQHSLGDKGLKGYKAHVVEDSSWISELEKRYGVISDYTQDGRKYSHYIFTFHDRSFECVASGYTINVHKNIYVIEALVKSRDFS